MPEGLRLALTMLTVAPLRPGRADRRTARSAMVWVPLVGGLLVLPMGLTIYLSRIATFGSLLPATVGLVTLALTTRGLHLDGLADTLDGLASHAPAPRALETMRSPEIGPLGVVAVALTLLVQFAALQVCIEGHRGTESVLLALLTSRLVILWSCRQSVPAARPDGLGALVAGTVRTPLVLAWTLLVAIEAIGYGRLDQDAGSTRGALRALLAFAVGLVVSWLLRRHVVRRLGGITGDVLGALVEVTQTVVLVMMATSLPYALRR